MSNKKPQEREPISDEEYEKLNTLQEPTLHATVKMLGYILHQLQLIEVSIVFKNAQIKQMEERKVMLEQNLKFMSDKLNSFDWCGVGNES